MSELAVVLANSTRWEGNDKAVKRFLALKDSLPQLRELPEVRTIRESVDDFLDLTFFTRLQEYSKVRRCFVPIVAIAMCFEFLTQSRSLMR